MAANNAVVQTADGTIGTWHHWAKTPYGWDGQWCGRESLTHAPNVYIPCMPAVYRSGKPATDPEWQYVWTVIRDVTFNLRDWKSGTPMLGLTDSGPGAGHDTPGPNEGVIEISDNDLGWCNAPCVVTLGSTWTTTGYWGGAPNVSSGRAIVAAGVTLTNNPNANWDADAVPMQTQPNSNQMSLGSIWAHELAHALGLNHPVAGPWSGILMQCRFARGETIYPTMDSFTGEALSWMYAKPWNLYPPTESGEGMLKLFVAVSSMLALLSACVTGQNQKEAAAATSTTIVGTMGGSKTALPEGSTPESVLSGLVQPPFVRGFVKLRIEQAGVAVEIGREVWTDYGARVISAFGPVDIDYRAGSGVTLRTPGGTLPDGRTVIADDGFHPLRVGDTVYALDREQGVLGGGNAPHRIVASIAGQDLFYVRDGKVTGEGLFASFKEDTAKFEERFSKK